MTATPIEPAPRIGIVRPSRARPVIAEIEARVIEHELTRRLGRVTLDLRVDGPRLGRWQPLEHAAWPGDIDARLDDDALWSDRHPPLAGLLARTIEPDAAAVRADMLRHLGVLPAEPFVLDDDLLDELDPARIRPTDLWLIARAASEVTVVDPAVAALVSAGDARALDELFDALVAALDVDRSVELARVAAERDELTRRVAELQADAARERIEVLGRFEQLTAELGVWRERAERAELGAALAGGDDRDTVRDTSRDTGPDVEGGTGG